MLNKIALNLKLGKENFWFLLPRPHGADEERIICFENMCELGKIETLFLSVGKQSYEVY